MKTTENRKKFRQYYRLAKQLMEVAEKETLAEVARILALHITHYEAKYGKISIDETMELLHSVKYSEEGVGVAANAMEYLTAVLRVATGPTREDSVH